jgi:hypothetical protein
MHYDRWFRRGRRDGYPLGYAIVASYLRRHPRATAGRLAIGQGDAILAGSEFRVAEPAR